MMEPTDFLAQLDEPKIKEAIAAAEAKSSGEIRIVVGHEEIAEPLEAAKQQFVRLGMDRTRERNAVLVYIAPRSRKFAVVGDKGIHEKCGDRFWEELTGQMRSAFREGFSTQALVGAVEQIGDRLARFFPRRPDDRNELSDEIAGG